jgi:hypothetical protein
MAEFSPPIAVCAELDIHTVSKLFTLYQIIAYTKTPAGVEILKVNKSFRVRTEHTGRRFILRNLNGI